MAPATLRELLGQQYPGWAVTEEDEGRRLVVYDPGCCSQVHEVRYTVAPRADGVWTMDVRFFDGLLFCPMVRRNLREYAPDTQAEGGWRVTDFQPEPPAEALAAPAEPQEPQAPHPVARAAEALGQPGGCGGEEGQLACPCPARGCCCKCSDYEEGLRRVEEATRGLEEVPDRETAVLMLRTVREFALRRLDGARNDGGAPAKRKKFGAPSGAAW